MKLHIQRTLLLVTLALLSISVAQAQEFDPDHDGETTTFEKVKEFFTFYPNARAVKRDSSLYLQKFIATPIVTFSPETSLGIGTGAKYLFKFNGSGEETRTSNMPISAQYTFNNQFIFYSGFEIFTNQERWVIAGNLLFQNYPRLYYGIGNDTRKDSEEEYNYYQQTIEPIFLKQAFIRHLFIGAGIRYNKIYNTEFEEGGLLDTNRPLGFDGSVSMGVEAAALYDSRDMILNAHKGWYLELTHGYYDKVLSGTHRFQLSRIDLRHYRKLDDIGNDVVAFQFFGRQVDNNAPINEYALFGSPEIMRGYREGRYTDRTMVAAQAEYRKTFKNSRWGAVAFLSVGDVMTDITDINFKDMKPSGGIGARFLVDAEERLNLRVDWGIANGSNHFYLGVAEAF